MRVYIDDRFWSDFEPRVDRNRRGWSIRLWKIGDPAPGFTKGIYKTLHIERR